jgi:hypothetical protein
LGLHLCGSALLTLESHTGEYRTFKVEKVHDEERYRYPIWKVSLLTGSNNACPEDYKYVGYLKGRPKYKSTIRFIPGRTFTARSVPFRTFDWLLVRASKRNFQTPHGEVKIFHEGRCARCGRRLTVPESVSNGLGPKCATMLMN